MELKIILPPTITDKDIEGIFSRIDDLDPKHLAPCLPIDNLTPIDEIDPSIIERDLKIFRDFNYLGV